MGGSRRWARLDVGRLDYHHVNSFVGWIWVELGGCPGMAFTEFVFLEKDS